MARIFPRLTSRVQGDKADRAGAGRAGGTTLAPPLQSRNRPERKAMHLGLVTLLKDFDRRRPAVPGENLVKLGLGVVMLRGGLVSKAIGAALIYRAFTGREGLARILAGDAGANPGSRAVGVRGDGSVDLPGGWPDTERVKVAAEGS
jgi:hypothetical protein